MGEGNFEDLDLKSTPEPEVVAAVVKEIRKLGDNSKASYEELRKNFETLKEVVDRNKKDFDAQDKERITKLSEDITVRQDALDKKAQESEKKAHERIDSIEVALKRLPKAIGQDDPDIKAAAEFQRMVATVNSKTESGVVFDELEKNPMDAEMYRHYKKAFEKYLRRFGGRKEMMMSPEEQKALMVGVDPDGGYTVTPEMSARIIQKIFETDPIRGLAATESITTGAIEWMVDWSEATAGWEEETVSGTETATPDFKKKRIPVHIMYAKPRVTQLLIEDSGINIEAWLANKIAEKMGRVEAAAFVSGTGVGQPRGFLTYANGTDYGQLEQIPMLGATSILADGLINVKYSLKEFYLGRGTWLMNRLTVAEVMKLKDGEGQYLWKPGMIAGDAASSLLGLPLRMATSMPVIAASSLSVVLADWAESYMIVDRLGVTVQRDPYTVKPFIEFYTRKRVGGDVVNYEAMKIGKVSVS